MNVSSVGNANQNSVAHADSTQNPVQVGGQDEVRLQHAPIDAYTDTDPQNAVPTDSHEGRDVINGNGSGTRLPSEQTTDGKTITKTQLAEGSQASIVREQTSGGNQNLVVINTKGNGNDDVQVTQASNGTLNVSVNGEAYELQLGQGQELGLRTGNGDDIINVAPNVRVNIVAEGGAGNDQITTGAGQDRIDGGEGNDILKGGDGRDDIFGNSGNDQIDGGAGDNILYGGDGDDQFASGAGTNYMDGGAGNDTFDGSTGINKISGGLGDDRIISGGKNAIYTGQGTDAVEGATSNDKIYAQQGVDAISFAAGQADNGQVVMNVMIDPTLGQSIKVVGSDAFVQRVQSELEFLRSSPNGQQMLSELDAAAQTRGHSVTIKELQNELNGHADADTMGIYDPRLFVNNGQAGAGDSATISYNPTFHLDRFPVPIATLYHEMSHAYNFVNGNFIDGKHQDRNSPDFGLDIAERQAVGLPSTGGEAYDFDGDPSTPATTHNPIHLTENGMRTELGMPLRTSYIPEPPRSPPPFFSEPV